MTRKKITGKKIAQIAGVSPTAVSFAVNGKPGLSEATRQHILDTMRLMGVHVKRRFDEAHNIAIMYRSELHELDQIFYTELNRSLVSACQDSPYTLILTSARRNGHEIAFSDILHSDLVDGIILYGDLQPLILAELKKLDIPIVVLDSSRSSEEVFAVRVDYVKASYLAANYLIGLGHTDITYIGNNNKNVYDFNMLTFGGFQKATTEHDISLATNRIQFDVQDEISLRRCIDKALSGTSRPTAIFCATDFYAILTIHYLQKLGIRVPDDISVISIDDIAISKYIVPALTTVRIDREEICRKGFELIDNLISGRSCNSVKLDSFELMVRESVRPLK